MHSTVEDPSPKHHEKHQINHENCSGQTLQGTKAHHRDINMRREGMASFILFTDWIDLDLNVGFTF